jgi:hypothetical protein
MVVSGVRCRARRDEASVLDVWMWAEERLAGGGQTGVCGVWEGRDVCDPRSERAGRV